MSDVPPPTNAFEKMMAAARGVAADEDDDPVLTAVLYEARLEHADPEEPLLGVPYFGQIVRVGTAEAVFAARKREHETAAAREDKDLGLHAVIDRFGPEAMAWRIVSSASGPRSEMQELANAEEIRLIDEHGGVLRDMDAKLTQTLNLTKGGKGDARAAWAGIDARRKRAYTKFQAAMAKYVETHDSALVPHKYVDEDEYPLGAQLAHFRQGVMWKGTPFEDDAVAWAEALPKWEWKAKNADDWHIALSQHAQKKSREAFAKFKAAMAKYVETHESALVPTAYVDDDDGYPLGKRLDSFRKGQTWKDMPWENDAKAWAEALPNWYWDARASDEYREGVAQRNRDRWANETPEQKADRIFKQKKTFATEAHKAKRGKITRDRLEKERRKELERARLIAVPFEKSKKRRVELRAASTDFSGKKGNAVLYMESEDGKTIRRVDKYGLMGECNIVGPVVDSLPPNEFESD